VTTDWDDAATTLMPLRWQQAKTGGNPAILSKQGPPIRIAFNRADRYERSRIGVLLSRANDWLSRDRHGESLHKRPLGSYQAGCRERLRIGLTEQDRLDRKQKLRLRVSPPHVWDEIKLADPHNEQKARESVCLEQTHHPS
jgi:hypothetical protein